MKEIRYFYVPCAATETELAADEARHAVRVLRLQAGDEIFLMDGMGVFYRAEVTLAAGAHCCYRIKETMPRKKEWPGRIHLAIAPTKMMDRMEWMLEKATEIGLDETTLLLCRYSERKTVRADRLDKIIVSAMKQSRKAWKPQLHDLTTFRDFIAEPRPGKKYIAHCYEELARADLYEQLQKNPQDEEITILVGPEGDFSLDEVCLAEEQGYEGVSLGESRLRTETAGLMAVAMAQLSKKE